MVGTIVLMQDEVWTREEIAKGNMRGEEEENTGRETEYLVGKIAVNMIVMMIHTMVVEDKVKEAEVVETTEMNIENDIKMNSWAVSSGILTTRTKKVQENERERGLPVPKGSCL